MTDLRPVRIVIERAVQLGTVRGLLNEDLRPGLALQEHVDDVLAGHRVLRGQKEPALVGIIAGDKRKLGHLEDIRDLPGHRVTHHLGLGAVLAADLDDLHDLLCAARESRRNDQVELRRHDDPATVVLGGGQLCESLLKRLNAQLGVSCQDVLVSGLEVRRVQASRLNQLQGSLDRLLVGRAAAQLLRDPRNQAPVGAVALQRLPRKRNLDTGLSQLQLELLCLQTEDRVLAELANSGKPLCDITLTVLAHRDIVVREVEAEVGNRLEVGGFKGVRPFAPVRRDLLVLALHDLVHGRAEIDRKVRGRDGLAQVLTGRVAHTNIIGVKRLVQKDTSLVGFPRVDCHVDILLRAKPGSA